MPSIESNGCVLFVCLFDSIRFSWILLNDGEEFEIASFRFNLWYIYVERLIYKLASKQLQNIFRVQIAAWLKWKCMCSSQSYTQESCLVFG